MQKLISIFLQSILKIFLTPFLKEEKNPYLNKIINLYKKDGFAAFFAKVRIWDSPFEQVERFVPKKGLIIDLGCGDGFFSNYLAIKSPLRKIVGVEINRNRIKIADKGFKNTKFITGDVTKKKIKSADTILMFHLLHHLLAPLDQIDLIKDCVRKLSKGGKLIIIEVDTKPIHKYLFSNLTDKVIVPILFERKFFDFNIHYRSAIEWRDILAKHGLKTTILRADKDKPFSHIIIQAKKIYERKG